MNRLAYLLLWLGLQYLCENLAMKEEESMCHPCWMLQLESFDGEYEYWSKSDAPITKENLSALHGECRTVKKALKFCWTSFNSSPKRA